MIKRKYISKTSELSANKINSTHGRHKDITCHKIQIQVYIYIWLHINCLKRVSERCVVQKPNRHRNNDNRFLFVLQVVVRNLRDEGRRIYYPCNICVSSARILVALFTASLSYRAVRVDCVTPVTLLLMFTIRCRLFLRQWGLATAKLTGCLPT